MIGLLAIWPIQPCPVNGVTWADGCNGLDFVAPGVIWSSAPVRLGKALGTRKSEFTLEILIQAPATIPRALPFFLGIDHGGSAPPLRLGQWRDIALMRVPREGRSVAYHELTIAAKLPLNRPCLLTVTCDANGLRSYVDGKLNRDHGRIAVSPDILEGLLILGDSGRASTTIEAWTGRILGLAFFRRSLRNDEIGQRAHAWSGAQTANLAATPDLQALYLFDEQRGSSVQDHSGQQPLLIIPATYRVIHRQFLLPDWSDPRINLNNTDDIALNVAAFVPWGLLAGLCLGSVRNNRMQTLLVATAAGMMFSLMIETVQIFLPHRDSSLTDVIANTMGTNFGALLWLGLVTTYRKLGGSAPPQAGAGQASKALDGDSSPAQ